MGSEPPPPQRPTRRPGERGSALLLVPAGILVLAILGALAVDSAVVFGAQRDLVATAEAAAADAAAVGVSIEGLRRDGSVELDRAAVARTVAVAAAVHDGSVTHSWEVRDGVLTVRFRSEVDLVFTKGVPGAPDRRTITATAQAVLVRN